VSRRLPLPALLTLAAVLSGCSFFTGKEKLPSQPVEFAYFSPYPNVRTVAIAPALNLSGSRDFDPLVVSDVVYAETQQVQNLIVLPVNKTLLAMQHLGIRAIDDAATAQRLAQYLGADGLIIPAVTAYDPYNPPVIGMVLQMYTPPAPAGAASPRPAASAGSPPPSPDLQINAPMRLTVAQANPDRPTVVADIPSAPPTPAAPSVDRQPVSQVSGVFNATNQSVLRELKTFANGRTQYDSALMDQKFLVDSDSYLRFVCNAMVRRLMDVERERVSQ